jgi:hypothetical protein
METEKDEVYAQREMLFTSQSVLALRLIVILKDWVVCMLLHKAESVSWKSMKFISEKLIFNGDQHLFRFWFDIKNFRFTHVQYYPVL